MNRPNFFVTMFVGFILTVFAFAPQTEVPVDQHGSVENRQSA